jgi:hypothetical protein
LLKLNGVTFEWRDDSDYGMIAGRQMGFIAQEVEDVFPELVSENHDGYKIINMRGMNAVIVESVKELNDHVDTELSKYAGRIEELSQKAAELKADLGRLEQYSSF